MIETKPPRALSLFDLIGRDWVLDAPIRQITFNAGRSAVACRLEDGRVALLPMADAEHPEKRVRIEFDTGRSTIRPRENPVAPPVLTDPIAAVDGPDLCRLGAQGFAVAGASGSLWRVTARGQCVCVEKSGAHPITAMCAVPRSDAICVARGRGLRLAHAETLDPLGARDLERPVSRLAVSGDGTLIAAHCVDRIVVLDESSLKPQAEIAVDGTAECLAWSPDGTWIVAGCTEKWLALVDLRSGQSDRIVDFPGPVTSAAFSPNPEVLIASGAFRIVGWRGPDLPFGTHKGDPVDTGKPGLTLVDRVAPNPVRRNCAAGYANGLVTLSPIGQPDELMLVEGTGAAVTAMDWSDDGHHLALGFGNGRAAILTFPKIMFK